MFKPWMKSGRKTPRSSSPAQVRAEELDVRPCPPAERHRLIFEKFDELEPGAAFVLINDHDPKPLYYQFAAEHDGEFRWEYQQKGPVVWRAAIGKNRRRG